MGKCALIVDDSRTSRAVLQRILETHDLAVDTAESAESALDYLTEHRPDVIFMDHLMPGMDGIRGRFGHQAEPGHRNDSDHDVHVAKKATFTSDKRARSAR